jgi:hypothetical protein
LTNKNKLSYQLDGRTKDQSSMLGSLEGKKRKVEDNERKERKRMRGGE